MIETSFDFESQNSQIKKLLARTRAFHRLRITRSVSEALVLCQGERG